MKYLKYTLVIVGLLSILGVGNAFAKIYYYANIEISALHGTWTSPEHQNRTNILNNHLQILVQETC